MSYRDKRLGKNYSEEELKHRKIMNKKKIKLDVKKRYNPDEY